MGFGSQSMPSLIGMEWLVTTIGAFSFLVLIHCGKWFFSSSMLENIVTTIGEWDECYGYSFGWFWGSLQTLLGHDG